MFGTLAWVILPSMMPGWALATVLDGSGDRWRKALLTPALGLLLLLGVSGGWLALGHWSPWALGLSLVGLNVVAYRLIHVRHVEVAQWTRWQRLEAAMNGVDLEEISPSVEVEAEQQRLIREARNVPLMALGTAMAFLALLSPMLQSIPFGVDWVGFAMLAQQTAVVGDFSLAGTNEGFWTYPPAFPSLAGWVVVTSSADAGRAVFVLGHYALFALLLGLMGALDRYGAGGQAMLAMGFGLALFAKVFDSGYPSVTSQLGLVVGLLVLLRPTHDRHRHHTIGLVLAVISVGLVHPTGAIYLALLMLSHVLLSIRIEDEDTLALLRTMAYVTAGLITLGFGVALLVFAPRLFDEAVFSEYGWQGGLPMLVYNGPLIVLAMWAGVFLRKSLEGRILITWFAMLWLLSLVHLIEGLQHVPVLSLLSYTLYSMALHAFHVPLAALVALWWSPSSRLSALNPDEPLATFRVPDGVSAMMIAAVVLGAGVAGGVALMLDEHEELWAVSPGDLELRRALDGLEGTVYTENMHWGYVWDAPDGILTTSIPSLGLVHIDRSEHGNASLAIHYDNLTYMQEHNMMHALTSPLGSMQWTLAASPYWEELHHADGAVLWRHVPNGSGYVVEQVALTNQDCEACDERPDPWRDHRFRDPLGLGDTRAFTQESDDDTLQLTRPATPSRWWAPSRLCLVYEVVGEVEPWSIQPDQGTERPIYSMRTDAGFHRTCMNLDASDGIQRLTVDWEADAPRSWLNPMGLSGRDNVLWDTTGVRWHWTEWR